MAKTKPWRVAAYDGALLRVFWMTLSAPLRLEATFRDDALTQTAIACSDIVTHPLQAKFLPDINKELENLARFCCDRLL